MLGDVDFTKLKYVTLNPADGDKPEVAINVRPVHHGCSLLSLLLALVVFIVVKKFITAFEKKKEEKPAAPPKQEVLLEAILDELKKR